MPPRLRASIPQLPEEAGGRLIDAWANAEAIGQQAQRTQLAAAYLLVKATCRLEDGIPEEQPADLQDAVASRRRPRDKHGLTAMELAYHERWYERDPKELIDEFIAELPDELPVYPISQKDSVAKIEPSRLEYYLMNMVPDGRKLDADSNVQGALSVGESINCLRDKVRTKLFLQGIAEAIAGVDESQETIEVCDAGTGGIPIMAVYAALCSDKVRCTALELNPESAEMARGVVKAFGLEDRITIVEADATTYQPEAPLDLLISETMHSALTNEPMVEIMKNLQPHVKPAGTTLPGAVHIKAAFVSEEARDNATEFVVLRGYTPSRIVAADWQDVVQYTAGEPLDTVQFGLNLSGLPMDTYELAIGNDVVIGRRVLRLNQSLITAPRYIRYGGSRVRFTPDSNHPSTVSVVYKPGDHLEDIRTSLEAKK